MTGFTYFMATTTSSEMTVHCPLEVSHQSVEYPFMFVSQALPICSHKLLWKEKLCC